MIFGSPYAAGYGSPENHLATLSVSEAGGGTRLSVRCTPASGFGAAVFGIFVNNALALSVIAEEGAESGPHEVAAPGGDQNLTVLRFGSSAFPGLERVARSLDETTSSRATLEWDWPLAVIGLFDPAGESFSGLSNWSFSGVSRRNCAPGELPTRGTLTVDLTVDGGVATVAVSRLGTALASGSGAVGSTVTLAAEGDELVSGSVDVDAGATTETGMTLRLRWPSSLSILRDGTSPPTTDVASVVFDGAASGLWTEPTALAAGNYYYAVQPVSDTGTEATASDPALVTIPGPPGAPSDLDYASGDAAQTVLSFTPSATEGATYRAYLRAIGDAYMDLSTPAATATAEAEEITLPALIGYPGTVDVLVRAVFDGIEERNGFLLTLEYDAEGDFVPARPNGAHIESAVVSSGTALSLVGSYSTEGQKGTATSLRLFLRAPDGAYDFETPDDSKALSASGTTGIQTATLTATLSAGWHYATVKAATAAGVLSEAEADEVLLYGSASDETTTIKTALAARG